MSQDYCRGCGTILQSIDPEEPGYVPETVQQRKQLICQRCYRITHYGEAGTVQPDSAKIRQNIQKAIDISQFLVLVVDFSDLAGTVGVWKSYLGKHRYVIAVNKIDLLPKQTPITEVVGYLKEYLTNLEMPHPREIIPVSGLNGDGIDKLLRRLTFETANGEKIALLGVTNVGKSSLVKKILAEEGTTGTPTISKFPGTTLGLSNWGILKGRNTLVDTPGLNPGNRLGDVLCPQCGSIYTAVRLERKLWGIKPGKGIIIGGIFGVENQGDSEIVLLTFTAEGIHFHRTDNVKLEESIEAQPEWLRKLCKECLAKLCWKTKEIAVQPNHDIAVAGLGWVSLRGGEAKLRLIFPEGIAWEIRPALIGKKE